MILGGIELLGTVDPHIEQQKQAEFDRVMAGIQEQYNKETFAVFQPSGYSLPEDTISKQREDDEAGGSQPRKVFEGEIQKGEGFYAGLRGSSEVTGVGDIDLARIVQDIFEKNTLQAAIGPVQLWYYPPDTEHQGYFVLVADGITLASHTQGEGYRKEGVRVSFQLKRYQSGDVDNLVAWFGGVQFADNNVTSANPMYIYEIPKYVPPYDPSGQDIIVPYSRQWGEDNSFRSEDFHQELPSYENKVPAEHTIYSTMQSLGFDDVLINRIANDLLRDIEHRTGMRRNYPDGSYAYALGNRLYAFPTKRGYLVYQISPNGTFVLQTTNGQSGGGVEYTITDHPDDINNTTNGSYDEPTTYGPNEPYPSFFPVDQIDLQTLETFVQRNTDLNNATIEHAGQRGTWSDIFDGLHKLGFTISQQQRLWLMDNVVVNSYLPFGIVQYDRAKIINGRRSTDKAWAIVGFTPGAASQDRYGVSVNPFTE